MKHTPQREKFATQVDPAVLSAIRSMAHHEGRHLQALVEEALRDLVEKRKHSLPRSRVMDLYQESHETFAPLYQKLAE